MHRGRKIALAVGGAVVVFEPRCTAWRIRKRPEKKREIRREKKAKEHPQQTSGSKAGVSVHNPFTGKSIKIKDGSYTHNRPVRQHILQWQREQNQDAKKNVFDKLAQMIAEAIGKGHTDFDTNSVPIEILNRRRSAQGADRRRCHSGGTFYFYFRLFRE